MWRRNRYEPRRGESAEDAFVRLYEERYGNVVTEENADDLVIELIDEPSARWIVVGLYPELAGDHDNIPQLNKAGRATRREPWCSRHQPAFSFFSRAAFV
jgi:hypothetical protein